jgi:ribulose-phosphate 3-epimerase
VIPWGSGTEPFFNTILTNLNQHHRRQTKNEASPSHILYLHFSNDDSFIHSMKGFGGMSPAQLVLARAMLLSMIGLLLLLSLSPTMAKSSASSASSASFPRRKRIVIGVDGGTESIRACCFDAENGRVVGKSCAVPYPTYHPQPGWAEQDPKDWWENLGQAVRGAVDSIPNPRLLEDGEDEVVLVQICSICVDTTCCSVVALDANNEPLRNCLLWMDARSAPQTQEIMKTCKGDPALQVNSGGEGPLSAEWMTPKALWIRQTEPEVWEQAKTICEYQDYINYKLTGAMCASSCNAAARWHWDGGKCIQQQQQEDTSSTEENPCYPGRPISLYQSLGIPELAEKLPQKCLPMGALVGQLTPEAAAHLGLPVGLPVAQGGADAFVGMIGLGCIHPGQLCLITGSSHLHCVVSSLPTTAPGTWGAYRGAPLPGINFAEGGQSSTGSIIRWMRNIFGATDVEYSKLDEEAAEIPPGCDGLVALETFQGSRTPVTDPMARGALLGLTLSHTRAHIWRAFMEAVCFGTRACIEGLAEAGHKCDEIVIAGGATRSKLWLQMHADVTGKPVVVCENADAPLLGCAILASMNAGVHNSVEEAVDAMVRTEKRVEPSDQVSPVYSKLYNDVYSGVGSAVKPIVHAIAACRGGHSDVKENSAKPRQQPIVSPSLLACDWSNIKGEVERCIEAGTKRLHVDIFDGVFLDSPYALTFGPQMVKAIRKCSDEIILDLHMCVERPARYVTPMKEAGGSSFIFQWEAMEDETEAIRLVQAVVDSGMDCGMSINPSTKVEEIFPLLKTGLVSIVDVLAVEPGFGGQKFQENARIKVESLIQFREENKDATFDIMVDGGINEQTAGKMRADILVAGSFLFNHPESLIEGVSSILGASATV